MTEKPDIPASPADLVEAPNTGVLTTVGADGQPQSTPGSERVTVIFTPVRVVTNG